MGPLLWALSVRSRKCSRMLATRIAATGTSVSASPDGSRVSITARSFLQKRRSTRFSAIGLTFQTSPWTNVTRSIRRIIGRVKAVIHAGRQPQRQEAPVAMAFHQIRVAEQVEQRIRRTLDLEQLGILDAAVSANDAIARGHDDGRVGIDRPQPGAKLPGEAVVQALELGLSSLPTGRGRKTAASRRSRRPAPAGSRSC